MQKKCRRCGELFTPVDGEFYCEKCGGTAAVAMPDERPEITVPETKIYTLRQAREKAGIDKKTISDKLQINVATYYNYESKGYMPKNLFLQFCAIVSIPPEQIKCREPMKPFRPTNICNVKKPADYDNKSMKSEIKTMENVKADMKPTGTVDATKHTHLPVPDYKNNEQSQINKGVLNMKKYRVTEYILDDKNNAAQQTVCTCATYEGAFKLAAEYRKSLSTLMYVPSVHIVEIAES